MIPGKTSFQALLISFLLLQGSKSFAQTTNISGVVNSYHKVIEVIPAKACLRVADPTGLITNNMVMVLQMKGASINTSNTASFGDTTSLNGAGFYETGTICYIIGDSIFLFHDLLNTYDVNAKVQLVQFAEYYSADVVDTVKAQPWDSTAGTGGVIAIFTEQDLTLTKPIWADSSGYKGGSYLLSTATCSNIVPANGYVYNAGTTNPQNGACKGESVAILASTQTGGRGAPANGGGGGNNHNNSGGGGANLAAGGIGGGNSSSLGCSVTLRGLGGKALENWQGAKIFAGGGGGAGHANNGFSTVQGGTGGGIIFIWSNNLIGNNQFISANGGAGGDSQSDGAGGGGAGGTIIMHVSNYTGNATIRADGGRGGNSADGGTIGRCYGGGGGGSGGVIYFTGATPALTISHAAGAAGVESGRDVTCAAAQAAGAGSNGSAIANYTFRRSMAPAGYCRFLLPAELLYFHARLLHDQVNLHWEITAPELISGFLIERKSANGPWQLLKEQDQRGSQTMYTATDPAPLTGMSYYRLVIRKKNGELQYTATKRIWNNQVTDDFSVYPNPAVGPVTLSGHFEKGKQILISDVSGKTILSLRILQSVNRFELPALPSGFYLIRYNSRVKKLIVR